MPLGGVIGVGIKGVCNLALSDGLCNTALYFISQRYENIT